MKSDRRDSREALLLEELDCHRCSHNEASHAKGACTLCACDKFVPKPFDLLVAEGWDGSLITTHLDNGYGRPACGSRTNSLNYDFVKDAPRFPDSGCLRCRDKLVRTGRATPLTPQHKHSILATRGL